MRLQSQQQSIKILNDKRVTDIIKKLKAIIYDFDKTADLILFGSRARGDWHEESDWDFLILTNVEATEELKNELRHCVLNEIELPMNEVIFIMIRNKQEWEEDYAVTNIYASVSEEGIAV